MNKDEFDDLDWLPPEVKEELFAIETVANRRAKPEEWLSSSQVMSYLGISYPTLWRLAKRYHWRRVRDGRTFFYRPDVRATPRREGRKRAGYRRRSKRLKESYQ